MLLYSGFRSDELTAINQNSIKKKQAWTAHQSPFVQECLYAKLSSVSCRHSAGSTSDIHVRYHRGCIEILNALL